MMHTDHLQMYSSFTTMFTALKAKLKACFSFIQNFTYFLIAPPVCGYCKKFLSEYTVLCNLCKMIIKPISSYGLVITKTHTVKVFAISDYKNPIRLLILAKGFRHIASARNLGILVWQMTDVKNYQFDYIVPVPLHWWRFAERGYNQAAEIAIGIQKQSSIPVLYALKRIRMTKRQSGLTIEERIINVQNAFTIRKNCAQKLRGKRILLVDDVMTTGSTLKICAQNLLSYKPESVIIGVASRVI